MSYLSSEPEQIPTVCCHAHTQTVYEMNKWVKGVMVANVF